MEIRPHWKKIWLSLKGESPYITPKDVNSILKITGKYLLEGIIFYESHSSQSFVKWKSLIVKETNNVVESFVKSIATKFNINAEAAWVVFCNYLMYEYYGKIEDIDDTCKTEMLSGNLLNSVWKFYNSERMFLIKILRYIIEKSKSENDFKEEFVKFINEKTITTIRSHLLKQLNFLIQERAESSGEKYLFYDEWFNRNYREQLEIMITILTTSYHAKINTDDLKNLFNVFQKQNIGEVNLKNMDKLEKYNVLSNIKCVQNAIVIVAVQDWWNDLKCWLPLEKYLNGMVLNISQDTDYAIIDLVFAVLLVTLQNSSSNHGWKTEEYQKYLEYSIKNKVFKTIYNTLLNPCLQNPLVVKELHKACCYFMEAVCFYFNTDNLIYMEEGSILVLCELFREHYIVEAVIHGDYPSLRNLYKFAVRMFPFDFEPLTHISRAIATHPDYTEKVLKDLENISGFTELYSTTRTEMETHVLSDIYKPFDNDTLIIESGTPVIIWKGLQGSYVTFKIKYSYFTVLQRLVDIFVKNIEQNNTSNSELLNKIALGFELFYDIAQDDLKNSIENGNINGCLMYINHLIIDCWKPGFDSIELLKICFKFCLIMVKYRGKETIEFLVDRNYLPKPAFKSSNLGDFLTSNLYQKAIITKVIFKENFTPGVIEVIELYLDFVRITLNVKDLEGMQTTGLVFVLLYIYPKLTTTIFEGNQNYLKVIDKCLDLLIFVLEQNVKPKKEKKAINEKLFKLMMESDAVLKSIVRIFAVSNTAVQEEMEKETNWENGSSLVYLKCIKKSLIATKLFLTSLNINYDEEQQKPITRKMCQIQYQKRNIIKILSTFLSYSFDINIPKIVCRIINCLAQNRKLLIYAMLEADHHQVNSMFLDRLRDPLYDEDTKVAIVELVSTCVESQFGMTASFFNVFNVQKQKHTYKENVANFMMEYLHNIKNSLEYLNNPLQNAILNLFYKLWVNKKSYLISTIIEKDEFWSLLMDPLFYDFNVNADTYTKIFAIITVELYSWRDVEKKSTRLNETSNTPIKTGDFNKPEQTVPESNSDTMKKIQRRDNLKRQISKFLTFKNEHVRKWLQFMNIKMERKSELDDKIDALYLLRTWKNFLIMCKKVIPEVLNTEMKTINMIKINSLKGLLNYFTNPENPRILNDYTALLLLVVSNYSFSTESFIKEDLEMFINILGGFANYYTELKSSLKESMMTILCYILEQQSSFLVNHQTSTAKLIELFCRLFIFEYEYLMIQLTTLKSDQKLTNTEVACDKHVLWILLLSIINKLLKLENIGQHIYYFKNYQILPSILRSVEYFINDCKLLKVAKITVQCVVNYAQSPVAEHFLMLDLNHFYESVRPPRQYINTAIKASTNDVPWYLKEFWIIYAFLLNLFHVLQVKFGFLMLEYSLSFMHLYDDILKYLAGLVKLTTDTTALQLTCSCLKFFEAIFQFKGKWWAQNEQSFNSILNSIKETLNVSIGVILRPNILVFKTEESQYLKFNKIETVPEEELIRLVDMHIQIISWCLRCLLRCSPDLMEILHPVKTRKIFFDLVEHDYRVPKLILENPQTLNYGSLLCTMHFLCKTLAQIAQYSNKFVKLKKKRTAGFKGFHVSDTEADASGGETAKTDSHSGFTPRDVYFERDPNEIFLSPEALHATQRFATSGVSGMSVPWLTSLDSKLVAYTLEILTTFLAQQIFISLQEPLDIDRQHLQFIKRELCSELQFFHDFIRKRVAYLYDYSIQGNQVIRSFAGKSENVCKNVMPSLNSDHSKYWGVHEMMPKMVKINYWNLILEDEREKPDNVPFLVEEDYLLFISHWFINMCSLTH